MSKMSSQLYHYYYLFKKYHDCSDYYTSIIQHSIDDNQSFIDLSKFHECIVSKNHKLNFLFNNGYHDLILNKSLVGIDIYYGLNDSIDWLNVKNKRVEYKKIKLSEDKYIDFVLL